MMRLERSDNTWRLGRRPMVAGGMAPPRPTPGRRSWTTVDWAASHMTPTQAQASMEVFQPSLRSWGMSVRNASSADRSLGGGSAKARHASDATAASSTVQDTTAAIETGAGASMKKALGGRAEGDLACWGKIWGRRKWDCARRGAARHRRAGRGHGAAHGGVQVPGASMVTGSWPWA
ncbi:uncharacterized protein [Triticum aestivum]|nr:uncharacterized protein LOC123165379 [Triticum aestivum]